MPVDNDELARLREDRENRRLQQQQRDAEERKANGLPESAPNGQDEERQGLLNGLFGGADENAGRGQAPAAQKRARDETIFDAIKINLCPTLRFLSFTVFIVMINIIMYIVSLSLYRMVNTEFLAPNPRSLEVLGWKDAKKIKNRNQIWRLLTPTFLHASFMHLALNTISILVIGSGLENGLGCWKLSLLYFVSSFGGILFSCVVNPMGYSVGASTAIFGLIGYYIAYLCIEWSRLGETNPMQRFTLIIFILLILLFNIQIGLTEANVDNLGHLGGLLTGIIMGFAIAEDDERRERRQSCCEFIKNTSLKNKIGLVLLFVYVSVLLLVFYLVIDA